MASTDYVTVTELPGSNPTGEQRAMLYTRYAYAASFAEGKDVLEIACGPGIGLGYLARKARCAVGGDYSDQLLAEAQRHYRGRVPLVRFDAHKLPFSDRCFDVIVFYEAIYYLADPAVFLGDCRRILRDGGVLLICSVNKEWPDFNRSPFSVDYYSISELSGLLRDHGFSVEPFGAFRVDEASLVSKIVSRVRRIAVALNLIPRTMKGKEFLKRLFYGKAKPLPPELEDGEEEACPLEPISGEAPVSSYKVIYAVSRLNP
ncbi:class I SAM-dependent methyltransferase [Nitrospinota bacterium]